jgi:hypothetical protein
MELEVLNKALNKVVSHTDANRGRVVCTAGIFRIMYYRNKYYHSINNFVVVVVVVVDDFKHCSKECIEKYPTMELTNYLFIFKHLKLDT